MKTNGKSAGRACAVLAAALVSLATPLVSAGQEAAAQGPDARAILMKMAGFLAAQDRFAVEVKCGYDSVQSSGKKVEFMEARKILADRPNRLRVEIEQSDGDRSLLLFDGKTITAQNLTRNVYAQTDAHPTLDDSVVSFVRDLHMRFPMAMLLLQRLPQELEKRLVDPQYVEQTSILGEPAHHILGSTDTVDFQIWVDAGKEPLPRRLVITYREDEGQPQFRAQFGEWDLSPRVKDSMFEFEAPAKATRIAFVTQLQTTAAGAHEAGKVEGASR